VLGFEIDHKLADSVSRIGFQGIDERVLLLILLLLLLLLLLLMLMLHLIMSAL
jgi:hypothetical protein